MVERPSTPKRVGGFSLLELSIVLVIIGLLAGGVMTGRALIRAAELRSVTTEVTRYTTAMNAFRDKYMAAPGDMKNATAFWGTAGTDLATCQANAGTGTATCNGNGDGRIGGENWQTTVNYENFRAWQHLANAGLIEGKYTGIAIYPSYSGYFTSQPGVNVPASKVTNGSYFVYYLGTQANNVYYYAGAYNNTIQFGAYHDGWIGDYPILGSDEASMIDTKLDDGKPGIGSVVAPAPASAPQSSLCSAGDTAVPAGAVYSLQNTGLVCGLFFKLSM